MLSLRNTFRERSINISVVLVAFFLWFSLLMEGNNRYNLSTLSTVIIYLIKHKIAYYTFYTFLWARLCFLFCFQHLFIVSSSTSFLIHISKMWSVGGRPCLWGCQALSFPLNPLICYLSYILRVHTWTTISI